MQGGVLGAGSDSDLSDILCQPTASMQEAQSGPGDVTQSQPVQWFPGRYTVSRRPEIKPVSQILGSRSKPR